MTIKNHFTPKKVLLIIIFGAFAIYLISTSKSDSFTQFWPLLLLLCPIMHIFMHGGHNHHHSNTTKEEDGN